ncbi:MAG: metallophosphoesterase family protein [Armatimonadota bacterium]
MSDIPIVVAAVGDIHWHVERRRTFHHHFDTVHEVADFLVLPGDLTGSGLPEEMRALTEVLVRVKVPVLCVLGNHDMHTDHTDECVRILRDAGVHVLMGGGDAMTFEKNGLTIGFCGTKGFCGGFGARCLTPFGEQSIKTFISETKDEAARIHQDLSGMECDIRIVVLHYAPVQDTVLGEPMELYPFLGSSLLCEPIDRLGADLVLHGHAHYGSEHGASESGIPVRNVALPVLQRSYATFEFPPEMVMARKSA